MNAHKRRQIFETLSKAIPEPKTELVHTSPFELLIAVMLSAQATDKGVNIATARLFPLANTPQAMLDLGLERVEECIRTINFFRTKARNVMATCHILVEQFQGQVPEMREALESLPGVGRKTANVILNTAFGHPTIAVDTHILRVSNRTNVAPGKTPLDVEKALMKAVPPDFVQDAHHLLILHGRYVCVARRPKCAACVIYDLCEYPEKTA